MKEYDIQKECINYFRENIDDETGIIFSVPNEACYKRKNYFENLGLLSGVSDTIIITRDKILFIEFKKPKAYQRAEQKDFEKIVTGMGYNYYIVHSLEEFKEIIDKEDIQKNIFFNKEIN